MIELVSRERLTISEEERLLHLDDFLESISWKVGSILKGLKVFSNGKRIDELIKRVEELIREIRVSSHRFREHTPVRTFTKNHKNHRSYKVYSVSLTNSRLAIALKYS